MLYLERRYQVDSDRVLVHLMEVFQREVLVLQLVFRDLTDVLGECRGSLLRNHTPHFDVVDAAHLAPRLSVAVLLNFEALQPLEDRFLIDVTDLLLNATVRRRCESRGLYRHMRNDVVFLHAHVDEARGRRSSVLQQNLIFAANRRDNLLVDASSTHRQRSRLLRS